MAAAAATVLHVKIEAFQWKNYFLLPESIELFFRSRKNFFPILSANFEGDCHRNCYRHFLLKLSILTFSAFDQWASDFLFLTMSTRLAALSLLLDPASARRNTRDVTNQHLAAAATSPLSCKKKAEFSRSPAFGGGSGAWQR
jgi:hypothetical protein